MRRVLVWLAATYLVLQVVVGLLLSPIPPLSVLRLQLTADAASFAAQLQAFNAAGWLPSYRRHYWADMLLPFSYGALGLAALRAVGVRHRQVLGMPLAAAACDLAENCCHLSMLAGGVEPAIVAISAACAWAKWALMGATVVIAGLTAARQRGGRGAGG